MKDVILKKILPILSVLVIFISSISFTVNAETLANDILSPTTCFTYTRSGYNGLVTTQSDSTINFKVNGVSFFYSSRDGEARPIDRLTIAVNLGNGYTFKKGVTYKINFKFVFPSSYAPGGSVGNYWNCTTYKAGFYSWASPGFNVDPDIAFLSIPQFDEEASFGNTLLQEDIYLPKFPVPSQYISYEMSYVDLVGTFVPSKDTVAKAFGLTFSGNFSTWYGTVGFGDFFVSMPYFDKGIDTPSYDSGNSNEMHNLESSLNRQNNHNLSEATGMLSTFSEFLGSAGILTNGLRGVTAVINRFLGNSSWISTVMQFSLVLGLVAFLLGSGISIYNQGHNKAERAKRQKGHKKGN